MRLPSTKFVVLNAAAGVVTVAALLGAARSMLFAPAISALQRALPEHDGVRPGAGRRAAHRG